MPDFEDQYDQPEPAWAPPPPQVDTWSRWEPRAMQVFAIHAVVIGLVAAPYIAGLITRRTANWMLICQSPTLAFVWAGLVAYLIARERERASGDRVERGRMLVLGLDVFTAIFLVMGIGFWLAILAV